MNIQQEQRPHLSLTSKPLQRIAETRMEKKSLEWLFSVYYSNPTTPRENSRSVFCSLSDKQQTTDSLVAYVLYQILLSFTRSTIRTQGVSTGPVTRTLHAQSRSQKWATGQKNSPRTAGIHPPNGREGRGGEGRAYLALGSPRPGRREQGGGGAGPSPCRRCAGART